MLTSRLVSMNEINVKRLGQQQKDTLQFLYENRDKVHQQVDIIESIHGEVTNSRKVSMSRTVNNLMDSSLVDSRKSYPSGDMRIKQRVHFFITEEGEQFLEEDSRFPNIESEDETTDEDTKTSKQEEQNEPDEYISVVEPIEEEQDTATDRDIEENSALKW